MMCERPPRSLRSRLPLTRGRIAEGGRGSVTHHLDLSDVQGAQSRPPVTAIVWPLINEAPFDARNMTTWATSWSSPMRPAGQNWTQNSRLDWDIPSRLMSVSKKPGTTTFVVMPLRPYSFAIEEQSPCSPALLAQ